MLFPQVVSHRQVALCVGEDQRESDLQNGAERGVHFGMYEAGSVHVVYARDRRR